MRTASIIDVSVGSRSYKDRVALEGREEEMGCLETPVVSAAECSQLASGAIATDETYRFVNFFGSADRDGLNDDVSLEDIPEYMWQEFVRFVGIDTARANAFRNLIYAEGGDASTTIQFEVPLFGFPIDASFT